MLTELALVSMRLYSLLPVDQIVLTDVGSGLGLVAFLNVGVKVQDEIYGDFLSQGIVGL